MPRFTKYSYFYQKKIDGIFVPHFCVTISCHIFLAQYQPYYMWGDIMNEKKLLIPQNKPKGDDGTRHLSVRLKKELLDRLDELTPKTNYSRNQLVSVLLNLALDNCEIENEE